MGALDIAMGWSQVGVALTLWTLAEPVPVAPARPAPPGRVVALSAVEHAPDERWVFVDYDAIPGAGRGGEWLAYDQYEVTRAVRHEELVTESELSSAVRLVLSEVGADRLLESRYGLIEAVAVLYTVSNRRDPAWQNPLNHPEAPDFPGCGVDGTFQTCANADQYLGMSSWRALEPASRYPAEMLGAATDVAVAAWWLHANRRMDDPTGGATFYVHRCGGAAYGLKTWHCDAHLGFPRHDVPGANPHTGPIVFRALGPWLPRKGRYEPVEAMQLDYATEAEREPYPSALELGALATVSARAALATDPR